MAAMVILHERPAFVIERQVVAREREQAGGAGQDGEEQKNPDRVEVFAHAGHPKAKPGPRSRAGLRAA